MRPEVLLYSRPGCHLCEDAERHLRRLNARYPHVLRVVDVTTRPDLLARYGHVIPVVAVGEREYAAPLTPTLLERALQAADG